MALWDTFESRIAITATLRAVTALRVGAGGEEAAQPASSDLPVLVGPDGQPFIPGSSLRGVVRSQIERIVRTLEARPGGGHGACNPVVKTEWCIQDVDTWKGQVRRGAVGDHPDRWLADQIWNGSCRLCQVFGSPWLASRVRIADLSLATDQGRLIERRDGVSIDRDKETVANKYDFEIVPAGTAFRMSVVGENLSDAEKGLLWLGLNELRDGHVLLGGFKGRGLGQATLEDVRIEGVLASDRAALRAYLINRTMRSIDKDEADGWLEVLWTSLEAN